MALTGRNGGNATETSVAPLPADFHFAPPVYNLCLLSSTIRVVAVILDICAERRASSGRAGCSTHSIFPGRSTSTDYTGCEERRERGEQALSTWPGVERPLTATALATTGRVLGGDASISSTARCAGSFVTRTRLFGRSEGRSGSTTSCSPRESTSIISRQDDRP